LQEPRRRGVGSAIEDYPLASVIVSGAITTGLISILFLRERRRRRRDREGDRHEQVGAEGERGPDDSDDRRPW
jgi:hypothetical protein